MSETPHVFRLILDLRDSYARLEDTIQRYQPIHTLHDQLATATRQLKHEIETTSSYTRDLVVGVPTPYVLNNLRMARGRIANEEETIRTLIPQIEEEMRKLLPTESDVEEFVPF